MDYVYYVGKASLVIRLIQHLQNCWDSPIQFMTVLHQLNGWVVRIKPRDWPLEKQINFQSFMNELGVSHTPNRRVNQVLHALEQGETPVEVMNRHQVAVIIHGVPSVDEIEVFRKQFIEGLGYCPETLA
ncbi:MAG: hypothetical protein AAGB01_12515 [Cyanobacteria bacterium P01_F01_bin.42]